MAGILIYSEKSKLVYELLTAAKQISKETGLKIKAVSINNEEQASELAGKGAEVYKINNDEIKIIDTAGLASVLQQAAARLDTNIILLASNRRGKELSGRLAQKLAGGCLNDVLSLQVNEGKIECIKNALGGATVATQSIETANKIIALAPKALEAAGEEAGGSINDLEIEVKPTELRLIESRSKAGDAVDIEAAEVLVAVGLGADQEDLKTAEKMAKALGGELACSKPVATDRKWLPEDRLIGLSGKKCKPNLAILLGISGQVQFMVGIREAGTIVAVNTDENANIMQMADYKMVAKIKDFLPEFIEKIKID